MRIEFKGKYKYFVTFTDDHSRWCEVRFLRNKSDVLEAFVEYKNYVEKQTGKTIKNLQSDNGKEYCNAKFDKLLTKGIKRRLTAPHTPQQNGIAERKNRTLIEITRCMLIGSGLPSSFWAEAVLMANYIRNRCVSLNGKTLFEMWCGRRPNVKHLRIFGEVVYVLNKDSGKGEFDPRGKKGIFVGYGISTKGYRIWLPEERKIIVSRDVKFCGIPEFKGKRPEETESDAEAANDSLEFKEFYLDQAVQAEGEGTSEDDDALTEEEVPPVERSADLVTRRGSGRPAVVGVVKYELIKEVDRERNTILSLNEKIKKTNRNRKLQILPKFLGTRQCEI